MVSKPLFLITEGVASRRPTLVSRVRSALEAVDGRVYAVQIREQVLGGAEAPASDAMLADIISQLLPVCKKHGAYLLLNGTWQLAEQFAVDGVQLGARSAPVSEVRRYLGSTRVLGYSAHGEKEVTDAVAASANFVLLSPVFDPISKPAMLPALGVPRLQSICALATVPVFALGGITVDNVARCRNAGASGIAGIGCFLGAQDVSRACLSLLAAWDTELA